MELFTADWELAIDCELAGEGGGGRTPLTAPPRSATALAFL